MRGSREEQDDRARRADGALRRGEERLDPRRPIPARARRERRHQRRARQVAGRRGARPDRRPRQYVSQEIADLLRNAGNRRQSVAGHVPDFLRGRRTKEGGHEAHAPEAAVGLGRCRRRRRPRSRAARRAPSRVRSAFNCGRCATRSPPIASTLRKLRETGFTEVEPAGLADLRPRRSERGSMTRGSALRACSSLGDALDVRLADAQALGARYVVSAMLRPGTGPPSPSARPLAAGCAAAAPVDDARRREAHGRRREPSRRQSEARRIALRVPQPRLRVRAEGGAIGYDVLLGEPIPAREARDRLRVDGRRRTRPVAYFARPGRFPLIHVKDFLPLRPSGPVTGDARRGLRGTIDYRRSSRRRNNGLEHPSRSRRARSRLMSRSTRPRPPTPPTPLGSYGVSDLLA